MLSVLFSRYMVVYAIGATHLSALRTLLEAALAANGVAVRTGMAATVGVILAVRFIAGRTLDLVNLLGV